jgi:hypothetical protein
VSDIEFATDHSGPQTTDGSDWIFEIEEAGHYQVVDFRNTPPDAARKLGLFLVMDLGFRWSDLGTQRHLLNWP